MPAKTELMEQLVRATEEVFETMVFRKLRTGAPINGDALRPRANVVGLVGFGGSVSGLVALYSTRDGAGDCRVDARRPARGGQRGDARCHR